MIKKVSFKKRLHILLFEGNTRVGKLFEIVLLALIILSVLIVVVETVPSIEYDYKRMLIRLEWLLTIAFTIEYVLRIYTANLR